MVKADTVLPVQFPVALMPNRLLLGVPSAPLISFLPQPVSSAACPIIKCAGNPLALLACWAYVDILFVKPATTSFTAFETEETTPALEASTSPNNCVALSNQDLEASTLFIVVFERVSPRAAKEV